MKEKIKIKVTKCSSDLYWYKKHIGQTFTVFKEIHELKDRKTYLLSEENYKQPIKGHLDSLVDIEDCEIIEP